MIRRCLWLAAAWVAVAVSMAAPRAVAADAFVLVIDSSGSMAEALGKASKLDAARAAVLAEIAHWPGERDLALVAYGHRRVGDCKDIETLQPLGRVDADAIRASLSKLRARGKTPLAASLRHAARLLPQKGGTIVLVSDGLETCHEDPCAVAEDLRRSHANLVIHVVGFGLPAKDMAALACIAGQGGLAIDAKDGAQLSQALTDVSDKAAATPPAGPSAPLPNTPPPAAPAPAPPAIVPVQLEAVIGTDPVIAPVRWMIAPKGSATTVYEGSARALTLDLPVGNYHVAISGTNATGGGDLAVEARPGGVHRIPIDAGLLRVTLVPAQGRTFKETDIKGLPSYRVEPLDGQPPAGISDGLTAEAMLAPGRYRITGSLGGFAASAPVTIKRGEAKDVALDLQLGRVTLEAVIEGRSEPIASGTGLDWSLVPLAGTGAPQAVIASARPTLVAAAGSYRATLTISGATLDAPVSIKPGSETTARVTVPASGVTLEGGLAAGRPAFDDWRDARWTVTPVALIGGLSAAPALDDKSEARPELSLLPGNWRVVLVSGAASGETELHLAPGERRVLRLDVDAARLTMAAKPASGAAPINIVFSAFPFPEGGEAAAQPLFTGGAREDIAAILPAGRYRITAADEIGRQAAALVVLGAGDVRRLDLELR